MPAVATMLRWPLCQNPRGRRSERSRGSIAQKGDSRKVFHAADRDRRVCLLNLHSDRHRNAAGADGKRNARSGNALKCRKYLRRTVRHASRKAACHNRCGRRRQRSPGNRGGDVRSGCVAVSSRRRELNRARTATVAGVGFEVIAIEVSEITVSVTPAM